MLTVAFSECTISRTQKQVWYNRFKEDRENVNEDARPGRPSTSTNEENIEAVKKMILDNRRITRLLMISSSYHSVHAKQFLLVRMS